MSLSTHSLKLSPLSHLLSKPSLKLTLSNSHLSVSLPAAWLNPQCYRPPSSTSPIHQPTHLVKLPSRQSTSDPRRRSTSLMLSTLSNSISQTQSLKLSKTLTFELSPLCLTTTTVDPCLWPDSPSSKLSLSSSSTCLGFFIWVCACIYKYRINKF